MKDIVKAGDWIKLVKPNQYYLLRDGGSYKVLEDCTITPGVFKFGIKVDAVIILNDLRDKGTYILDDFELDIEKNRNEVINNILS